MRIKSLIQGMDMLPLVINTPYESSVIRNIILYYLVLMFVHFLIIKMPGLELIKECFPYLNARQYYYTFRVTKLHRH